MRLMKRNAERDVMAEVFKVGDEVMWEEEDNMAVIGIVEEVDGSRIVVKEVYAAGLWGESDAAAGELHTVQADWLTKHTRRDS